jgi:hypothetical protein
MNREFVADKLPLSTGAAEEEIAAGCTCWFSATSADTAGSGTGGEGNGAKAGRLGQLENKGRSGT